LETKGNKYIFITIEGEYYTLLHVQKTRKTWEVLDYETNFDLTHSSEGTLSQLIQKAKENKWLNEPCYLVLPRHEITSRIIDLPSQDIEEIKNMVSLSAEEFVPYALEEIQISQCILETLPDSQSRVFVAIAHRDLIQEKIKTLQNIGWEPSGLLVSTGLLINSASEILKKSKQAHSLFVHLTLAGIEVAIFENNALHFSRGVRTNWENAEITTSHIPKDKDEEVVLDPFRSSVEITPSEENRDEEKIKSSSDMTHEVLREIRTSINSYQRDTETEVNIDTVYISSDFPINPHLKEELNKFLDIPCVFLSANDYSFLQFSDSFTKPISATLLGIGLSLYKDQPLLLNLLPEELIITHKLRELSKHIKRVAILFSLLALSLGGWFIESIYQRQQLIRELEGRVAELEPNARGIAEKRQQLQILRREVAKSGSFLDYLAQITSATPPRVNMNMVSYRRIEGINIWGRAKTIDDIHTFAENLRRQAVSSSLKAFQQARSVYEQQTREQNEIIFDYQIAIPFTEEEKTSDSGTTTNP